DVKRVTAAVRTNGRGATVLVGSGVTDESAGVLLQHADALIVGSFIKQDGHWANPVDRTRAAALVKAARG
ncbi:MAG: BtpA/SgcQ family protein, partial [Planctomycetota bacterium]